MKFKLTDREKIALGYDEPSHRDDPDMVRAIVRKCGKRPEDLTAEEIAYLSEDVSNLATFGTDPADSRTAAGLQRKVLEPKS